MTREELHETLQLVIKDLTPDFVLKEDDSLMRMIEQYAREKQLEVLHSIKRDLVNNQTKGKMILTQSVEDRIIEEIEALTKGE